MYIVGELRNDHDFVLNKLRRPEERERLIIPLKPARYEAKALAGRFNIVLGY
jgi:hypothetical protein